MTTEQQVIFTLSLQSQCVKYVKKIEKVLIKRSVKYQLVPDFLGRQ